MDATTSAPHDEPRSGATPTAITRPPGPDAARAVPRPDPAAARGGPHPTPAPLDLVRQIVVIASVTFMLIAAVIGSGMFSDTAVQHSQGGALDSDATLLAPAGPAFSIWSAIYLLLIAYTVWQALPAQRSQPRQRVLGWWIAASAVLNGMWLVAAQFGTLLLTVIDIVVLLIVLCVAFRYTVVRAAENRWDAFLVDVTTGLHLGWVSLATVANTTAWLTDAGVTLPGPEGWAVGILAVVTIIGIAVGIASRGRFAPAVALAWGLGWLAVGRLIEQPQSQLVGIAAIVAAVLIAATPAIVRLRTPARKPEAYARVP